MLSIEYTLKEEEYLAYNLYTVWLRPEKKKFRFQYSVIFPLLFFIAGVVVQCMLDRHIPEISYFILLGVIAIALAFFLPYRIKAACNSNGRKLLEKSGPDTLLSPTELTISENGIFGKNNVAEVKYQWNAFKNKAIHNNCCYLYINFQQALVIPFRAFQAKEDKDKFESLLSQYLPLEAEFSSISKK